jgi:hypothetical protein
MRGKIIVCNAEKCERYIARRACYSGILKTQIPKKIPRKKFEKSIQNI